jgi:succinyl-CoA synthetase beta subunit
MVKLFEYQGKEILKREGIKVPDGRVVSDLDELMKRAKELNFPIVLKAQVLTTGRLKAGAIKFAQTLEEAEETGKELFGKEIKGLKVEKILLEEKLDYEREYYLSIIVSDSYKVKAPEIIFSPVGGVDIEGIAEKSPEKIVRFKVDYLIPFEVLETEFRKMLTKVVRDSDKIVEFVKKAYKVFVDCDARVLEINPIFLSKGDLIAGDCKITIDDSSVFRHPEFEFEVPRDMDRPSTELEKIAWKIEENDYRGTAYFIQLNEFNKLPSKGKGYIAFHGIGGGASMLAADALIKKGLVLANYADSSGNPPASKIYRLLKVILAQEGIEGYVMMGSVFASQEQWHHAHALVKAFKEIEKENPERVKDFPVVVLLAGNKEKESHEILRKEFGKMGYAFELYGRDHIYKPELIAERVVELVERYRVYKIQDTGESEL